MHQAHTHTTTQKYIPLHNGDIVVKVKGRYLAMRTDEKGNLISHDVARLMHTWSASRQSIARQERCVVAPHFTPERAAAPDTKKWGFQVAAPRFCRAHNVPNNGESGAASRAPVVVSQDCRCIAQLPSSRSPYCSMAHGHCRRCSSNPLDDTHAYARGEV